MIIDCLSKAILLFVIYNVVTLMLFGVPKSLSSTYYLFKSRQDSLKVLFPVFVAMLSILLTPCWLEISVGSEWQFLAFLSGASLLFVAATPAFNNSQLEDRIHDVAAYLCVIFATLWIILATHYWYVILIVLGIIAFIAIRTKTWKTGFIYWLEIVAFISTFISITCYHVSQIA